MRPVDRVAAQAISRREAMSERERDLIDAIAGVLEIQEQNLHVALRGPALEGAMVIFNVMAVLASAAFNLDGTPVDPDTEGDMNEFIGTMFPLLGMVCAERRAAEQRRHRHER